jgi:aspartate/methionine/tyrosine aminotransferase
MLNFRKAREALAEIRTMHIGKPENDPKTWDIALALEAMVVELDHRPSGIEQAQQAILQQLRRRG